MQRRTRAESGNRTQKARRAAIRRCGRGARQMLNATETLRRSRSRKPMPDEGRRPTRPGSHTAKGGGESNGDRPEAPGSFERSDQRKPITSHALVRRLCRKGSTPYRLKNKRAPLHGYGPRYRFGLDPQFDRPGAVRQGRAETDEGCGRSDRLSALRETVGNTASGGGGLRGSLEAMKQAYYSLQESPSSLRIIREAPRKRKPRKGPANAATSRKIRTAADKPFGREVAGGEEGAGNKPKTIRSRSRRRRGSGY